MEQETSCLSSKVILEYLGKHNNGDCSELLKNLDPKIDAIPDPEGFLSDPNNWISCAVVSKLFKRAKWILNDYLIPDKIAQYAVENLDLGFKSLIVKVLGSPSLALKNAQRINAKWNRTKEVELVDLKKTSAILRLHWDSHMGVSKDICLFNQGFYSFNPIIWGGDPVDVIEEKCYFEGADCCEYHLKWTTINRLKGIFSRFLRSEERR